MTLFKTEYRSSRHTSMTGEMRTARPKTGAKRASSEAYRSEYEVEYESYPDDLYDRVFEYQRVPASMPVPVRASPVKRSRGPASSLALHRSRDRPHSRTSRMGSSSKATLKMAELLAIKRDLTQIKVQIDGLLDSVDKMDKQRKDHSDSPPNREGSMSDSSYRGSVSSLEASPPTLPPTLPLRLHRQRERESPEPGEASDDEHLQHHRISNHLSDLEEDM